MSLDVQLQRDLFVPRDLVFDAWTQAEHLSGWYLAGDDELERLEVGAAAEGAIELRWRDVAGATFAESGVFSEARRPDGFRCRLELSGPQGSPCRTTLSVRLVDLGGACRIELAHTGFSGQAARDRYADWWAARLARLEAYFSAI